MALKDSSQIIKADRYYCWHACSRNRNKHQVSWKSPRVFTLTSTTNHSTTWPQYSSVCSLNNYANGTYLPRA